MTAHLPIFVYGTLKRGQVREGMWPHAPKEVRAGTTRGALFDLGAYPALADGDGCVAGELWFVRREHVEATLAALDRIECFGQDNVDLYVRRIVECRDADGRVHRAYAYFFADPDALQSAARVMPDAAGRCRWPAKESKH